MRVTPPFIEPDWPAPASVLALSTLRWGGRSAAPFESFNLGAHVGDDENAVATNREILAGVLPDSAKLSWLSQVHGTGVIEAGRGGLSPVADAQWSHTPGAVCAVLTADCLPVLLCSTSGAVVAAAHAGWRGLHAGILAETIEAMHSPPEQLLAWLGPAIGPDAFEVGVDVRDAFLSSARPCEAAAVAACFVPVPDCHNQFLANLYALARVHLNALGVTRIFGGDCCTHGDSERFFSYRRDGQTGRMASLIVLR